MKQPSDGLNFTIYAQKKMLKPHLEMFAGRWMCFDDDFCGWGATAIWAFADWNARKHGDAYTYKGMVYV